MKILTFDVEEWFHILDNESTKTFINWNNYESRIYENMEKIFNLLDNNKLKATFFVVGWIADKYPDIIKEIDKRGFEIGSHTYMHQLMYEQNKNQVRNDLKKSINIIQDLTGKKVLSFRAPGFSIVQKNKWVFEILIENGIKRDCSIFPSYRSHGGFPNFKTSEPSLVIYKNQSIKEFPINTVSIFGIKYIFSGGGYFRVTPYYFINKWSKSNKYIMTYFHPRDFDPHQPVIKELSIYRKFKSYVGLSKCYNKLDKWINNYDFVDLDKADKLIDWKSVPVVRL